MRNPLLLFFLCGVFALAVLPRSASADDRPSSDSTATIPKNEQYLIGMWKCDVTIPALNGRKGLTYHPAMTVSVAANMTLFIQFAAKQFTSASYLGYDMGSKTHWLTATDTVGELESLTSNDGIVYTGTSSELHGASVAVRATFTKLGNTKRREAVEIKERGKWTQAADIACTKT